jgi:hypothetical protein
MDDNGKERKRRFNEMLLMVVCGCMLAATSIGLFFGYCRPFSKNDPTDIPDRNILLVLYPILVGVGVLMILNGVLPYRKYRKNETAEQTGQDEKQVPNAKQTEQATKTEQAFNFDKYPKLEECHREYTQLSERTFELDKKAASEKEFLAAVSDCEKYDIDIYAKVVYDEFFGKGIILTERKTDKKLKFDEVFGGEFTKLSNESKQNLTAMAETEYWGDYRLPAEYYK